MSRTYHPSKRKRQRAHGFRRRQRTVGGRKTIALRRKKRRQRLTV